MNVRLRTIRPAPLRLLPVCYLTGILLILSCYLPSMAVAQRQLVIVNARIETVSDKGVIDQGTLLLKNGKIEAIGEDIAIPVSAQVIDAQGKTLTPGIVDPYYVVRIGRNVTTSAPRTIVFNGRTFIIGGRTTAIATTFAKVVDGFELDSVDWGPARRSGITTVHLVTGGYAQSAFASPQALADLSDDSEMEITQPDGLLMTTVSNDTKSLTVLRNGLKEPSTSSESSSSGRPRPSPEQLAALRARFGNRIPSSMVAARSSSSSSSSKAAKPQTPVEKLWSEVRAGKTPVFVNVNNASAILHVDKSAGEKSKAKIALIASGQNLYLNLDNLDPKRYSAIIPPRIDQKPNSRYRINVPAMMAEKDFEFAFSLSLGQSDFRSMQHNPLFAVGMLVRSGLDRELALKALTLIPAKLLGMDKEIGSIEVGKAANLVMFDGDPLAATSQIEQVFINGKPVHE